MQTNKQLGRQDVFNGKMGSAPHKDIVAKNEWKNYILMFPQLLQGHPNIAVKHACFL